MSDEFLWQPKKPPTNQLIVMYIFAELCAYICFFLSDILRLFFTKGAGQLFVTFLCIVKECILVCYIRSHSVHWKKKSYFVDGTWLTNLAKCRKSWEARTTACIYKKLIHSQHSHPWTSKNLRYSTRSGTAHKFRSYSIVICLCLVM